MASLFFCFLFVFFNRAMEFADKRKGGTPCSLVTKRDSLGLQTRKIRVDVELLRLLDLMCLECQY